MIRGKKMVKLESINPMKLRLKRTLKYFDLSPVIS